MRGLPEARKYSAPFYHSIDLRLWYPARCDMHTVHTIPEDLFRLCCLTGSNSVSLGIRRVNNRQTSETSRTLTRCQSHVCPFFVTYHHPTIYLRGQVCTSFCNTQCCHVPCSRYPNQPAIFGPVAHVTGKPPVYAQSSADRGGCVVWRSKVKRVVTLGSYSIA